jgi:cytochrome c-type biogenesis protein CcmF
VMEKREALKVWTIFLAILAFSLSLVGTFIVRSGVLTSVHSFANDPRRGVFILAILVFFIGGALLLFALRANTLKPGGFFAPISREGALVLNNLVLTTICATVFVGEMYPLALESLTGEKISVGGPFFNATVVPLFLPLVLLMPVGQNLAWKRGDFLGAAQRLYFALLCGLALMLVLADWHQNGPLTSILVSGLGLYLIVGAFAEIVSRSFGRAALVKGGLAQIWRHAVGLPLSTYGTAIAHAGIGVSLLGLAATGWGAEKILTMKPGDSAIVGPYQLTLMQIGVETGPNFTAKVGHVVIRKDGRDVAAIDPAVRFYPTRQMSRAEAGIKTIDFGQVYVGISNGVKPGTLDARLYWKPLVTFIWIGALIMGFGGFVSLSDRRLRIGVAHRVRRLADTQQAPAE